MSVAGIPSCIIRFACHIPTGIAGFNGKSIYGLIQKVDDIQAFPEGEEFLKGLKFVAKAGLATFGWNFVMFGLSVFAFGPFLFAIGLVDAGLAIPLLLGILSQSNYLSLSSVPCDDAVNWRNGTDGRNIFVDANLTSTDKTPNSICSDVVANMKMTIGVIAMYFLCALLNVIIGILTWRSFSSLEMDCSCCPCFGVIFRPLVATRNFTSAGVRYTSRYLSKLLQSSRNRDMGFKAQDEYPMKGADFQVELALKDSQNSSARHHFIDVVQSKLVPIEQRGNGTSVEELRRSTCDGASKSDCKICRMQICGACSSTTQVANSVASVHLTTCKPYCTTCFYINCCRRDGDNRRVKRRRQHWYPCQLVKGKSQPTQRKDVCRQCASKTREERQEMIEHQDRQEVYRLAQHPLACFQCMSVLPQSGPRWWVCSTCNIECTDHIHPPWASKP